MDSEINEEPRTDRSTDFCKRIPANVSIFPVVRPASKHSKALTTITIIRESILSREKHRPRSNDKFIFVCKAVVLQASKGRKKVASQRSNKVWNISLIRMRILSGTITEKAPKQDRVEGRRFIGPRLAK